MKYRKLGNKGPEVSALGLGTMGMSPGLYGEVDDDESVATIQHALDLGVTLIDTANIYGEGHNERLVGRAIAGRRNEVTLATKFGIVPGEGGNLAANGRPEYVREQVDESLGRLGSTTWTSTTCTASTPTPPSKRPWVRWRSWSRRAR